jgi:hypothetical protein
VTSSNAAENGSKRVNYSHAGKTSNGAPLGGTILSEGEDVKRKKLHGGLLPGLRTEVGSYDAFTGSRRLSSQQPQHVRRLSREQCGEGREGIHQYFYNLSTNFLSFF